MSDYQDRAEIDVIATDLRANEDRCDHCRHRRNDEWCEVDMRAVETRKEKLPDSAQIYDFESLAHFRLKSPDGRCPHFQPRTWQGKLRPVAVSVFFLMIAMLIAWAAVRLGAL